MIRRKRHHTNFASGAERMYYNQRGKLTKHQRYTGRKWVSLKQFNKGFKRIVESGKVLYVKKGR